MTFFERTRRALAHSPICVGLDTDIELIPGHIRRNSKPVLTFNKAIIDATIDLVGAYKPNFAFYEGLGAEGWHILKETVGYIREKSDMVMTIADAKRGDVGNTAKMYADAILKKMDFDCVTVNPLMGYDSVAPFLEDANKGAFILCLTSNSGSADFQFHGPKDVPLYLEVARRVVRWNGKRNCGLVVGATRSDQMEAIRQAAPGLPFLIPGVGVQGGDLQAAVSINRINQHVNAFINASRSVLYASHGNDFADAARKSVLDLRRSLDGHLTAI